MIKKEKNAIIADRIDGMMVLFLFFFFRLFLRSSIRNVRMEVFGIINYYKNCRFQVIKL